MFVLLWFERLYTSTINVTPSNDQWGQTYLIEGQAIGQKSNKQWSTKQYTEKSVVELVNKLSR